MTDVPTESPDHEFGKEASPGKKGKKKAKEITFARPLFANEFFTEEARQRFDELPQWQRHLVKRLVDHGNLKRAAREANVSRFVNENIDLDLAEKKTITEALTEGGITPDKIVDALAECLQAESIRFDSHGNPIQFKDLKLKLNTISLICQLRGDFKAKPEDDVKTKDKGLIDLFEDTKVDDHQST